MTKCYGSANPCPKKTIDRAIYIESILVTCRKHRRIIYTAYTHLTIFPVYAKYHSL